MTDCCDERVWLDERIAAKRAAILAFETGILALAGGAQSYSLDTGQTRQVVTKSNLSEMRNMIARLESDLSTLMLRRFGCANLQVRPGW
jgi:hypothetical protein